MEENRRTKQLKLLKNSQKGITVLALAITIVVLIILAGITINYVFGDDGIIKTANDAAEQQNIAEYLEIANLVKADLDIERTVSQEPIEYLARFQEELKKKPKYEGSTYVLTEDQLEVTTKEGYIIIITETEIRYDGKGEGGGGNDFVIPESDIEFIDDPAVWTNQNVTLTINSKVGEGTLEYSEDASEWKTYEGPITVSANKTIYTRIKVSDDRISNVIIHDVWNIDKENPQVGLTVAGRTETTLTVRADVDDQISGVADNGYHFYYKINDAAAYTDLGTSNESTYTLENITADTKYQFKVEVVDKANNKGEATVETQIGEVVARIDENYFETVQLAVDSVAADNNQKTVVLLKDRSESVTIPANKNIIFDVNQKTFTGNINNSGTLEIENGTVTNVGTDTITNNGGTLNIKASNATINNTGANLAVISNQNSGTVNIENGTFNSVGNCVMNTNNGGNITISNGNFTATQAVVLELESTNGKLTVTGGTFNGNYGGCLLVGNGNTAELSGGTFNATGEANILGNDGGNLTIKGSTTFNASNVNTGELFYPAMQNVSGGTINIENLTMTGACALYNFAGSGAVNISGGNFQTTTYTIINEANGGKVTLSGGTFTTSGTITIGNDSQTEITGSAILTSSNTSASRIVDNTKTATLTVSGGTIEAKGTTMAIQNIDGTINITGGTIKAQNNNAIANQGIANISGTAYVECANYDKAALFNFTGGTTTMTGGTLKNTVSGGYALYKQGGTVTVTGGSAEPKNF